MPDVSYILLNSHHISMTQKIEPLTAEHKVQGVGSDLIQLLLPGLSQTKNLSVFQAE